jgi:hypothetical protein
MELFLHVGINKTGSSAIQSSMAINARELREWGVYIPYSKWEQEMMAGKITPGNGHQLAKALAEEDGDKVSKHLNQVKTEAQKYNCTKVVLSNEVLIRLFSNETILKLLSNEAKKIGFVSINVLCFLRNIYEHGLSLYKHRAKSGKYLNYSNWLNSNYETLRVFEPFLCHYQKYDFDWQFRLYPKDSQELLAILYKDFMGVNLPAKSFKQEVNPSLTLNNIRIIQFLEYHFPGINRKLYPELININKTTSENGYLLNRFNSAIEYYLLNHAEVINKFKRLLRKNEQHLLVENRLHHQFNKPENNVELEMSDAHLNVIENVIRWYKKNHILIKGKNFYKTFYKTFLKGIKSRLANNSFDSNRYGGSLR